MKHLQESIKVYLLDFEQVYRVLLHVGTLGEEVPEVLRVARKEEPVDSVDNSASQLKSCHDFYSEA